MRLIYEKSKAEVQEGDIVRTTNSHVPVEVLYFNKPHKPNSEGRVTVALSDGSHIEYYVGVIGAKWIEREDHAENTIPCKHCNKPTTMLGTKMCDRCWELKTRMSYDIKLTHKILQSLTK